MTAAFLIVPRPAALDPIVFLITFLRYNLVWTLIFAKIAPLIFKSVFFPERILHNHRQAMAIAGQVTRDLSIAQRSV